MQKAIELSLKGSSEGKGGPFGAVIVKDGKIVGQGHNNVLNSNDPTAHAEIVAIRDACKNLGTFQLSDCELYTSCEPCPMCLGAIYWARPKKVYYANTREDAAEIGFDDAFIYDEIPLPISERKIQMIPLGREEAQKAFKFWVEKQDKTLY
ncbi:tRNA(Arg) A34 adenosine deaminase TadA [Pseudarcicella hirudinis]|uniref:tRNA(Arg) A34 adenosine deaminase TadA n=2 Tax=Pseudarcicella hirudinis TaxID=1079859 RepID=A0A1I5X1L1_9BACT|nr:tRNA(Arg) A34 adenosine deaminase TadA [Pseudarcicella hirudinis]